MSAIVEDRSEHQQKLRRARGGAILLALVAASFYLGFIIITALRG